MNQEIYYSEMNGNYDDAMTIVDDMDTSIVDEDTGEILEPLIPPRLESIIKPKVKPKPIIGNHSGYDETMDDDAVKVTIVGALYSTDKAWLLEVESGEEVWFPKSKCRFDEQNMVVWMPYWLYARKF